MRSTGQGRHVAPSVVVGVSVTATRASVCVVLAKGWRRRLSAAASITRREPSVASVSRSTTTGRGAERPPTRRTSVSVSNHAESSWHGSQRYFAQVVILVFLVFCPVLVFL